MTKFSDAERARRSAASKKARRLHPTTGPAIRKKENEARATKNAANPVAHKAKLQVRREGKATERQADPVAHKATLRVGREGRATERQANPVAHQTKLRGGRESEAYQTKLRVAREGKATKRQAHPEAHQTKLLVIREGNATKKQAHPLAHQTKLRVIREAKATKKHAHPLAHLAKLARARALYAVNNQCLHSAEIKVVAKAQGLSPEVKADLVLGAVEADAKALLAIHALTKVLEVHVDELPVVGTGVQLSMIGNGQDESNSLRERSGSKLIFSGQGFTADERKQLHRVPVKFFETDNWLNAELIDRLVQTAFSGSGLVTSIFKVWARDANPSGGAKMTYLGAR